MKIVTEYNDGLDVIEVKSATYSGNFILQVNFNDGISQNVDFKPFLTRALHPSIKKYSDETVFQNFSITDGNLNWNDYEMIFPLKELYDGHIK